MQDKDFDKILSERINETQDFEFDEALWGGLEENLVSHNKWFLFKKVALTYGINAVVVTGVAAGLYLATTTESTENPKQVAIQTHVINGKEQPDSDINHKKSYLVASIANEDEIISSEEKEVAITHELHIDITPNGTDTLPLYSQMDVLDISKNYVGNRIDKIAQNKRNLVEEKTNDIISGTTLVGIARPLSQYKQENSDSFVSDTELLPTEEVLKTDGFKANSTGVNDAARTPNLDQAETNLLDLSANQIEVIQRDNSMHNSFLSGQAGMIAPKMITDPCKEDDDHLDDANIDCLTIMRMMVLLGRLEDHKMLLPDSLTLLHTDDSFLEKSFSFRPKAWRIGVGGFGGLSMMEFEDEYDEFTETVVGYGINVQAIYSRRFSVGMNLDYQTANMIFHDDEQFGVADPADNIFNYYVPYSDYQDYVQEDFQEQEEEQEVEENDDWDEVIAVQDEIIEVGAIHAKIKSLEIGVNARYYWLTKKLEAFAEVGFTSHFAMRQRYEYQLEFYFQPDRMLAIEDNFHVFTFDALSVGQGFSYGISPRMSMQASGMLFIQLNDNPFYISPRFLVKSGLTFNL